MESYHFDTTVAKNGMPLLPHLPMREGQRVSVTIELKNGERSQPTYPLRNLPLTYIDPFEPAIPPEDWDVLRDDVIKL
jgi:hypothetical protein